MNGEYMPIQLFGEFICLHCLEYAVGRIYVYNADTDISICLKKRSRLLCQNRPHSGVSTVKASKESALL